MWSWIFFVNILSALSEFLWLVHWLAPEKPWVPCCVMDRMVMDYYNIIVLQFFSGFFVVLMFRTRD